MLRCRINTLLIFLFALALVSGCGLAEHKEPLNNTNQEGYFSVKDFLNDQWHLLGSQPIVLLKVAEFNGKTDSTFVPLDSTLWKNIRKQFDPTDIGAPRFLNQYTFSTFSDDALNVMYINYEANNPDLLTQKLNISADNANHKIRSVFIQTREENRTYEKTQKLTYAPHRLIQIQTFEKSIISKPEELLITYYFSYK